MTDQDLPARHTNTERADRYLQSICPGSTGFRHPQVHATDLRFREETATVDKEVEIYLAEMRKRDRKRGLDQEERVRNAQGDTDGLDDVRALAAKWLRDAET